MDQSQAPENAKHVIVVLDDDSAVRHSIKFLLEIEGFEVRCYASPAELLNDADQDPFHCLIIDYHIPEMNGLDVVSKLQEGTGSILRAILVTSQPDAVICERAAALGVAVVLKPFRGTELLERIRAFPDDGPTARRYRLHT
jgi:two-component system response regulator FixJ